MATNERNSSGTKSSNRLGKSGLDRLSIRQSGTEFIAAVRQRPLASAAIAAGAAGAGAFLWAKRGQISDQFSDLTESVSERFGSQGGTQSGGIATSNGLGSNAGTATPPSVDPVIGDELETGSVAYGS